MAIVQESIFICVFLVFETQLTTVCHPRKEIFVYFSGIVQCRRQASTPIHFVRELQMYSSVFFISVLSASSSSLFSLLCRCYRNTSFYRLTTHRLFLFNSSEPSSRHSRKSQQNHLPISVSTLFTFRSIFLVFVFLSRVCVRAFVERCSLHFHVRSIALHKWWCRWIRAHNCWIHRRNSRLVNEIDTN